MHAHKGSNAVFALITDHGKHKLSCTSIYTGLPILVFVGRYTTIGTWYFLCCCCRIYSSLLHRFMRTCARSHTGFSIFWMILWTLYSTCGTQLVTNMRSIWLYSQCLWQTVFSGFFFAHFYHSFYFFFCIFGVQHFLCF